MFKLPNVKLTISSISSDKSEQEKRKQEALLIQESSEKIQKIFEEASGYKIVWKPFSNRMISTAIIPLAFAYVFYTLLWLKIVGTISFWDGNFTNFLFGLMILSLPLMINVITFWTYILMLFDQRLSNIVKHISKSGKHRKDLSDMLASKFKNYRLGPRSANSQPTGKSSPTELSDQAWKDLADRARKEKAKMMTELVQKVSIIVDETTLSGYYYPLVLLQIIVAVLFSFPAIEFANSNTIGVTNLDFAGISSTNVNNNAVGTSQLALWTIEWGIFGAFVYSFISLMDRVPKNDVTPRFYLNMAIRYIFSVALSALFFLAIMQTAISSSGDGIYTKGAIAAIAFTIGMFPNTYLRILLSFVGRNVKTSFSKDVSIERFPGLSPFEITRLWEEGIHNVDQLADSSVQELYKRTRFNPDRLQGIVGSALLWKYVYSIKELGKDNTNNKQEPKLNNNDFSPPDAQSLLKLFKIKYDPNNQMLLNIISAGDPQNWLKELIDKNRKILYLIANKEEIDRRLLFKGTNEAFEATLDDEMAAIKGTNVSHQQAA